jgi:hypothetical protein
MHYAKQGRSERLDVPLGRLCIFQFAKFEYRRLTVFRKGACVRSLLWQATEAQLCATRLHRLVCAPLCAQRLTVALEVSVRYFTDTPAPRRLEVGWSQGANQIPYMSEDVTVRSFTPKHTTAPPALTAGNAALSVDH